MLSALVFDMDGVLVDTSQSYQSVVVETLRRILAHEPTPDLPEPTLPWVHALKRAGGFNNDWDLSRALLRGVLSHGPSFDVHRFASDLRQKGGGPNALDTVLGPAPEHRSLAPDALVEDGVKRLFQELYLGDTLFQRLYGGARTTVETHVPGYIDRETPLFSGEQLRAFGAMPLAVATGRPTEEARYSLELFGVLPLFQTLVTHDDAVAASAPGKPNPWVLEETRRRLGLAPESRCVYVGDLPDDMLAAKRAGFIPIGFRAELSINDEELKAAGAEHIVTGPAELATLVATL